MRILKLNKFLVTKWLLVALIAMPPAVYFIYYFNLDAALYGRGPDGSVQRLLISSRPIIPESGIKAFYKRAIISVHSTHWQDVDRKYSREENDYFSDMLWGVFRTQELESGVVAHMENERLVRYVVTHTDPVILKASVADGRALILLQAKFIRTYRGRSSQRSQVFVATSTLEALRVPRKGNAFEVVEYHERFL